TLRPSDCRPQLASNRNLAASLEPLHQSRQHHRRMRAHQQMDVIGDDARGHRQCALLGRYLREIAAAILRYLAIDERLAIAGRPSEMKTDALSNREPLLGKASAISLHRAVPDAAALAGGPYALIHRHTSRSDGFLPYIRMPVR